MTNRADVREQIRRLRGDVMEEALYTHAIGERTIEIVGVGFENYPEADFYQARDNGIPIANGDTIYNAALAALNSTHDTAFIDVMQAVEGKEFSW